MDFSDRAGYRTCRLEYLSEGNRVLDWRYTEATCSYPHTFPLQSGGLSFVTRRGMSSDDPAGCHSLFLSFLLRTILTFLLLQNDLSYFTTLPLFPNRKIQKTLLSLEVSKSYELDGVPPRVLQVTRRNTSLHLCLLVCVTFASAPALFHPPGHEHWFSRPQGKTTLILLS